MKRYQHKILEFTTSTSPKKIEEALFPMEREGWQVAAVYSVGKKLFYVIVYG